MVEKLVQASNAIWSKERPVAELLDDNIALSRKNRCLWAGLIGLSALSICSIGSCRKASAERDSAKQEIVELSKENAACRTEWVDMKLENRELRSYADNAQAFALGIRPWLDENDSGCEDPNCATCKKMEAENKKKVEVFEKSCDALNIDPAMLQYLQKGVLTQ